MQIETGRHTITKTLENLVLSVILNEVENELHFTVILSCHFYDIYFKCFEDINRKIYNHFDVLDDRSKILFIFNNVDPIYLAIIE